MKYKILRILAVAVALVGLSVLGGPSTGQAVPISISDVVVHVGPVGFGNNFCGTATCSGVVASANHTIWAFPPTIIPEGGSLLLAQTGGVFNFDTSDFCLIAAQCATPASITIFTNLGTFVYTDTAGVISFPAGVGLDTLLLPPLETREFAATTGPAGPLSVLAGYADSAHLVAPHPACATTGPGSDGTGGNPINCFPDPFSSTVTPQQSAANTGGDCLGPIDPCYDTAVIKIFNTTTSVPEPATLLLLGSGLLGFAAWGRRRLKS